jgi:hypothetical protein
LTKFSKEVEVDWQREPTALKLHFKARWSWRLHYGRPPSGIEASPLYVNEDDTLDPIWALPPNARILGILNPDGVEIGRINLYRDEEQFRPIFYRTVPSEGVTLRMGPRWREQHDIESVRSREAVVYGWGLVTEEGGTDAVLLAALDGVLQPCPQNCIIEDEVERCLRRGAVPV